MTEPKWLARLFGAKAKMTLKDVTTIVMACPVCATPLVTMSGQLIEHRDPLTLALPIRCPYAIDNPHAFKVVEGKISLA
jgi:hypothetical protein